MSKTRVLIIDIDILTSQILKSILNANNYETTWVSDGDEALLLLDTYTFDIIITELIIPGINGKELMEKLLNRDKPPLIILQSYAGEKEQISKLMTMGAVDYFLKPVNREEALFKVNKARELMEKAKEEPAEKLNDSLQNEIEYKIWKEDIDKRNTILFDKALFYNIKTSFCQGAGFGAVASLLSIVKNHQKIENDRYLIEKKVMDLLLENNEVIQRILDQITDIANIVESTPKLEELNLAEIQQIILDVARENKKYARLREHKILFKPLPLEFSTELIMANKSLLKKAFKEILINAYKFSLKNSSVVIKFLIQNQKLMISFINEPERLNNDNIGIPLEMEKLVFTPFFRITKTVQEIYNTLDYGLGLSVVYHIIHQHNGQIFAINEKDEDKTKVHVDLEFSLLDSK